MKLKVQIIVACFFCASCFCCSTKKSTESLSSIFCECAVPIVEWKSALTANPSKLSDEPIVRKKVEACLEGYKSEYTKFKNDTLFQNDVKQIVFENCPEVIGSVPALFKFLFQ